MSGFGLTIKLPSQFQGLLNLKNRFPAGGVMLMLLVPLAVVMA
jgi:hypothetical protein